MKAPVNDQPDLGLIVELYIKRDGQEPKPNSVGCGVGYVLSVEAQERPEAKTQPGCADPPGSGAKAGTRGS